MMFHQNKEETDQRLLFYFYHSSGSPKVQKNLDSEQFAILDGGCVRFFLKILSENLLDLTYL